MFDPDLRLAMIKADKGREIVAASRGRLLQQMARRPLRARLAVSVGRLLVRVGSWLIAPEAVDCEPREQTAE